MRDKHQQLTVSVYLLSAFSAILSASESLCLTSTKNRRIHIYETFHNT